MKFIPNQPALFRAIPESDSELNQVIPNDSKANLQSESTRSQFKINRKKENKYALEDIFDGLKYKKFVDKNALTINMNIDGVPHFESSNYNAVPILCTINETHPMQRRKHVMLTALWCGKHKPPMKAYLRPFIEEARVLNEYSSGNETVQ